MQSSRALLMLRIAFTGVLMAGFSAPCFSSPVVVERNLFSPDRKPPSPDSEASSSAGSSPAVPPKALQLDGIFIHGDTRKALVRFKGQAAGKDKGKDSSPFVSVREGDKISDYVVNKIGSKSIFVEKGGQTFEIYLYASGKVLPPLAPAAPPPTAPAPEPAGETIGDRRARRGQPPQPGASPGEEGMGEVGGVNIGERPQRVPRSRSPNDPRQRVQIPDDEMPDEMDEELDMGEE
ncbi:MAG: hypothetical protein MUC41_06925 [Syntrophobacteraceae bacterium]|jgi:hypothetical protein|nr:hypothetical protein [Syntrophobacteraceae bacterium]